MENLPVALPAPVAPDVGIEITEVTPQRIFPGDSFRVSYRLVTPTGYSGQAEVTFYLRLQNSYTTLAKFPVELSGANLSLSRDLTTFNTMFPGSYTLGGEVEIPGDGNPSNNTFAVEEPFVIEALNGDPHDIGIRVTKVSPLKISPGDALTFEYTLLNLTGYVGPVDVSFILSTSGMARIVLTEKVMLDGEPREIVRHVPTPDDLPTGTYRPTMRVRIENDTDPENNTMVFREVEIEVAAPSQALPLSGVLGEPPPPGDLTEGNLSEWQLEAFRGGTPVNPGIRLGNGSVPIAGGSFLTGVARPADRLILRYPRTSALRANWDLSNRQTLEFWFSPETNPSMRNGNLRIVLRSAEGSRVLTLIEPIDWTLPWFQHLRVPLAGDAQWRVATHGDFDNRQVTSFELDFQFDDAGRVSINLDEVQFGW